MNRWHKKPRSIHARIGSGPLAETVEKVLAELILKASINKAKRLNGGARRCVETSKKHLTGPQE